VPLGAVESRWEPLGARVILYATSHHSQEQSKEEKTMLCKLPRNVIVNEIMFSSLTPRMVGLLTMVNTVLQRSSNDTVLQWFQHLKLKRNGKETMGELLMTVLVQLRVKPHIDDKRTYTLLTFGKSTHGCLGNSLEVSYVPHPVNNIANDVVFASMGGWHMLFITKDGRVYGCGSSNFGQLGFVTKEPTNTREILIPCRCQEGEVAVAVAVCAGSRHSVVLTNEPVDNVRTFGSNSKGQLGLPCETTDDRSHVPTVSNVGTFAKTHLHSVAAGNEHTLFLTSSGQVYGCGSNSAGQISTSTNECGNITKKYHTPIEISQTFFDDKPVIMVVANHNQSACLTVSGCAYLFGSQLFTFFRDSLTEEVPKQVKFSAGLLDRIVGVALGARHTLLLRSSGKVEAIGEHFQGQLGCVLPPIIERPFGYTREPLAKVRHSVVIPELENGELDLLRVGAYQNSSVVYSDTRAFSFGDGMAGNLGHGKISPTKGLCGFGTQELPKQIESLCSYEEIVSVSIGHSVSSVIVSSKKGDDI